MKGKTGVVRLSLMTGVPVYPCASWGPERVLPPYGKIPKLFPRTKVSIRVGEPIDFAQWKGRESDPQALDEATDFLMDKITELLEAIRGEKAPTPRFDPKSSDLPRIGNFKKVKKT